jgi:hypothetical protein
LLRWPIAAVLRRPLSVTELLPDAPPENSRREPMSTR